jgi:hypothetical protein
VPSRIYYPNEGYCYSDAPDAHPLDGRIVFHNQWDWDPAAQGLRIVEGGALASKFPGSMQGDVWPRWSPDGRYVAFLQVGSERNYAPQFGRWMVMAADGSDRRSLDGALPAGYQARPGAWSPDGQWIVSSVTVNGVTRVYRIPAFGGGAAQPLPIAEGTTPDFVGSVLPANLERVLCPGVTPF